MLLSDACQREVGVFSLFICFDATKFVLLGPFTIERRFALEKWGKTTLKNNNKKVHFRLTCVTQKFCRLILPCL